jgi:hypothetical protein
MQSQKSDVWKSVELIEGCHEFLKEYKENCVQRAISAAMEFAIDLEVEPEFQSVKTNRIAPCSFFLSIISLTSYLLPTAWSMLRLP